MMRRLFFVVILILGCAAGYGAAVLSFNLRARDFAANEQLDFRDLLSNSTVTISGENWHCGDLPDRRVGTVLADILRKSMAFHRNVLSASCQQAESVSHQCSFGYSDCLPWEEVECGSRLLTFSVDAQGKAMVSTFSCLDVP